MHQKIHEGKQLIEIYMTHSGLRFKVCSHPWAFGTPQGCPAMATPGSSTVAAWWRSSMAECPCWPALDTLCRTGRERNGKWAEETKRN